MLDVATGTGHTALGMARHLPQGWVCGIDFSKGMLAVAREKQTGLGVGNVKFIEMDMQAIQFPDRYFDMAVSSFSLFFAEDMARQLAHMAEVKDLCDEQGLWLEIEVIYTTGITS